MTPDPCTASTAPEAATFRSFCTACAHRWTRRFAPFCDRCGAMSEVEYDLDSVVLRDSPNPYERFQDLLPVHDVRLFPADATPTPTIHAERLGAELGLPHLYLKNETVHPTGTTKDRMAAVALAYLFEGGVRGFCASSTGNSSTSFAHGIARFPGMTMYLFIGSDFRHRVECPDHDQVVQYVLDGATFVEAVAHARTFAERQGLGPEYGYFNPGRREGLKLAFLEAVEQVPRPIDWYVQAISSAMGVHGTFNGAQQLRGLGRIDRLPRLLCVQQETCAPMVAAWREGVDTIAPHHLVEQPTGIAQAILRGDPTRSYPHVRRRVIESAGTFAAVSETEIREARKMVEELEGVSPCFAASAAVAGLIQRARAGEVVPEQTVLVNLTGSDRESQPDNPRARWLVRAVGEWVSR